LHPVKRSALVLAAAGVVLSACGGRQTTPSPDAGRLAIVATTTVFADLVKQVGGDRVDVLSLVPQGGEVHTFDPAPSDAVAVSRARLLVMNGLGLDDWLLPFAQQAGAGNLPVLKLGEGLVEVDYIANNPHLWMNAAYAELYVDRIRLKLIELDPAGQPTYDANAGAYQARLVALDDWARQQMLTIPDADRRVVSFHDAFPYFAAAYDLEIVGVVVDSPGQDPSAAEVARLVDAIRQTQVGAILTETQFSPALAETIASETGARVVQDLYTDTLGDPPIDSYEAAIRWDVEHIVAALK
jgi:zinc/manganese transport system substrate-binding protein/manganese/iron transport system substrate-binding protein